MLTRRNLIFPSMAVFFMIMAGCGSKTDTAVRFEMERLLSQADRLQDELKIKGPTLSDSDFDKLISEYRKVVDKAPAIRSQSDIAGASEDKRQAWAVGSLATTRIGTLYFNRKMYEKAFASFNTVANNPATTAIQKNAVLSYMALATERLGHFHEAAALYDSLGTGYLPIIAPENPNLDALNAPIKSAEMWMKAGDNQRYAEKIREAETYYRVLIDKYKGTLMEAAAVGKLSGIYLQQTRFADAIEILRTIRDDSTGFVSPTILLTVADIYMNRLRDFRSAEKCYRDFLEYYPRNDNIALAQLGLGLSLFEQTKFADARKAVYGIEKAPNARAGTVAQASFLVGLCFEKEDKWELAKVQFDLVQSSFIGTDHAFEAALHVPGYYRSRGKTDLAQKAFDSAIRYIQKNADENTDNPTAASRALGYLVRAYTENGDYDKAAQQLSSLHERFSQFPEGRLAPLRLGEIYENVVFDTSKAIDWLRIFVKESPEDSGIIEIKNHISDLESRMGRTSAAN